jgi:hypothetical protein
MSEGRRPSRYVLLSPRDDRELDLVALDAQARRFFATSLEAAPSSEPTRARVRVGGDCISVEGMDREAEAAITLFADAETAIARIGGAGFDALAARARRLWILEGADPSALVLAAVIASVHLAPIHSPIDGKIFGVRGARERLEAVRAQ